MDNTGLYCCLYLAQTLIYNLLWTGLGQVKEMETITDKSSNTNSSGKAPEDVDSNRSDPADTSTAGEGHYSNLDTAFSLLPAHEHK